MKIDLVLYFAGALFIAGAAGTMTETAIGFITFGVFVVAASFLK